MAALLLPPLPALLLSAARPIPLEPRKPCRLRPSADQMAYDLDAPPGLGT